MSDFENVCDAVLKGAFYFCLGFLIVIPCLVLLVLPIIVLASEGFWALIALEMLARGLTDAGHEVKGQRCWRQFWRCARGGRLRSPGSGRSPASMALMN